MFCTKCGLKNDDDSLFCAGCGNKLRMPQSMQNSIQKDSIQENNVQEGNLQEEIVHDNSIQKDMEVDNISTENNISDVIQSDDGISDDSVNSDIKETDTAKSDDNASNFDPIYHSVDNNTYSSYDNNVYNNQIQNQMPTKNKFSVKRFIFSALVMIAAIISCLGIAYKYIELSVKSTIDKEEAKQTTSYKGYEIIKDKDFCSYEYLTVGKDFGVDEKKIYEKEDDIEETQKLIKYLVIAAAIVLIIFAVIEFILLIAVRRRWVYVLSMLFSMISLGLSIYIVYLWCFEFIDEVKEMYKMMMYLSSSYVDVSVRLSANIGVGLIIIIAAQAVAFIASIVLMTCKNRPKVRQNV